MRVVMINGPMGVGKTATGKYIAEKNEGTAFIDGDWRMGTTGLPIEQAAGMIMNG